MSDDPIQIADVLDLLVNGGEPVADIDGALLPSAAHIITVAARLLRTIPELAEKAWMYDDLCK